MLTKTNNQPNQKIVNLMTCNLYSHTHTQTHTHTHTHTHKSRSQRVIQKIFRHIVFFAKEKPLAEGILGTAAGRLVCCTPGKSVVLSLGITLEQALLALNYGLKKNKKPQDLGSIGNKKYMIRIILYLVKTLLNI